MMSVIADTGFIVAVAISTDQYHAACAALLRQQDVIYVPQTTLAEVLYLIGRSGGNAGVEWFLRGLSIPHTKYQLVALERDDIQRTAEILHQYADARLDAVDATVIAIAERLNITTVLTLDKRDFGIVRPRHTTALTLLP
jgi:uncharacterized protein